MPPNGHSEDDGTDYLRDLLRRDAEKVSERFRKGGLAKVNKRNGQRKRSRPDATFLGRLLHNSAKSNDRTVSERAKASKDRQQAYDQDTVYKTSKLGQDQNHSHSNSKNDSRDTTTPAQQHVKNGANKLHVADRRKR
jgi:gas vesicle protein